MPSNEQWKDAEDELPALALCWRFLDDSPAFALGVEVGKVAQQMLLRVPVITQTIHAENDEQLQLAARHYGYRCQFTDAGEEWTHAIFTATATETTNG